MLAVILFHSGALHATCVIFLDFFNLDMEQCVSRLSDPVRGPDALPCSAWKYAPNDCAVLYGALTWVLNGNPVRRDFNALLAFFPFRT